MHFQPVGSHNVNESVTHLRVVVTEENQSNRWRKEAAPSNHATTWLLLETLSVSTDSVCLLAACRENALETQPWAWPALGYVWPRSADNLDTSQMFSAGDMFPRDVKWQDGPSGHFPKCPSEPRVSFICFFCMNSQKNQPHPYPNILVNIFQNPVNF